MDRKTCTGGTDFQHCCCPSSLSAKSRAHCVIAKIQPSRAWESKNWCQGGSSDVIGTNLCSRSFRKLPVKSAYCRIPCWDWGASARPFVSYARVWFTVYVTCSPAQAAFTLLPSLTLFLVPASLPHVSLNTSSLLSFRSLLSPDSFYPSLFPPVCVRAECDIASTTTWPITSRDDYSRLEAVATDVCAGTRKHEQHIMDSREMPLPNGALFVFVTQRFADSIWNEVAQAW